MKYFSSEAGGRIIVIRLTNGDLLLESILKVIREEKITDGTLISGYGTLKRCVLHMINTTDSFPAGEDYPAWEGSPLELVSMTGIIADSIPHIHAVVSDKGTAVGGHLEPGCETAYLAEIVIYEHQKLALTRRPTLAGPLALESR